MPHDQDGHVSKDQFVQFCATHPEMFEQMRVVFASLRQAAGFDWEEEKTEQQSCSIS
jgi:hypothetical protein